MLTLRHKQGRLACFTHHGEVFGAALRASVEAGEQHVLDVVTRPVVEFTHVEGAGLIAVKISPLLQDLQDVFLHQVRVSDLVPGEEDSCGRSDY